ncbi:MAG: hypothetical protein SVK54_07655 [candidate division WOR-3 bacterium]|nr:hypothetical protein [candidate division WOR-3 bacterium]
MSYRNPHIQNTLFTAIISILYITGFANVLYAYPCSLMQCIFTGSMYAAGFVIMYLVSRIEMKIILAYAYLILTAGIVIMAVNVLMRIFVPGFSSFVRIELFMHIALIAGLARMFYNKEKKDISPRTMIISFSVVISVFVFALLLTKPGNGFMYILIYLTLLCLADIDRRMMIFIVVLFITVFTALYGFYWILLIPIAAVILFLLKTGLARIILYGSVHIILGLTFSALWKIIPGNIIIDLKSALIPGSDIYGYGWRTVQSVNLIQAGGITGTRAIDESYRNMLAGTVLGHVYGFAGIVFITVFFLVFYFSINKCLPQIKNRFSQNVLFTLSTTVIVMVLLHLSSAAGIFPFIDVILPFYSHSAVSIVFISVIAGVMRSIMVSRYEYY